MSSIPLHHTDLSLLSTSPIIFPSHIILLVKDSPPSIISTFPSDFHDRANQLENELLRVRKEKGLDSEDYDLTLASVLSDLYELVGKPVVERLRRVKCPGEISRLVVPDWRLLLSSPPRDGSNSVR
jgi:hypothetical protein